MNSISGMVCKFGDHANIKSMRSPNGEASSADLAGASGFRVLMVSPNVQPIGFLDTSAVQGCMHRRHLRPRNLVFANCTRQSRLWPVRWLGSSNS